MPAVLTSLVECRNGLARYLETCLKNGIATDVYMKEADALARGTYVGACLRSRSRGTDWLTCRMRSCAYDLQASTRASTASRPRSTASWRRSRSRPRSRARSRRMYPAASRRCSLHQATTRNDTALAFDHVSCLSLCILLCVAVLATAVVVAGVASIEPKAAARQRCHKVLHADTLTHVSPR